MNKIWKLLWIIFVLCIVSFIICDEKWIKIWLENNHLVFNKVENSFGLAKTENITIKNPNLIRLNPEFKNPKSLRSSNWLNFEYIAKLKEDKKYEERLAKNKKDIDTISLSRKDTTSDIESISSLFEDNTQQNNEQATQQDLDKAQQNNEQIIQQYLDNTEDREYNNPVEPENVNYNSRDYLENNENTKEVWSINIKDWINSINNWEDDTETWNSFNDNTQQRVVVYYPVKKYSFDKHTIKLSKWTGNNQSINQQNSNIDNVDENSTDSSSQNINWVENNDKENTVSNDSITNNQWNMEEDQLVKRNIYQLERHTITLRSWKVIEHNFAVDNSEQVQNNLSDDMLADLLKNEEIDIDTLESENDEFLQKVFQQTRDIEIMNLIVENYLNEYQFIKAKRFIENLPKEYVVQLTPSLYLRVAFNSFSLSSKNVSENLSSIIQDYASKKQISNEDASRYNWVLSLMNQNYDRFFEISTWFTSEKYKTFTSKLQWYKAQISKQMWMPEYYFDTLVSLELFNQWLFQPAKVLSLYSLQKNPNYILPYQILAYANFLTNSRDTSMEYLKKLVDLDPTNAEKYRFLIWVANYRDEKYGQSAIMLTMIKRENLRLDAERYLIRDYLFLKQNSKLISSRNKLLWYENLVASDFYTYFYEAFFHPYAEWQDFKIYSEDTELANKMLRVCSMRLQNDERVVCMYWSIWKNIAEWKFDWLEQSLLKLVEEYPQWYLYHALWEYYIKQWDLEKAKAYLLKAVSSTQKTAEKNQIKKLLEDTM